MSDILKYIDSNYTGNEADLEKDPEARRVDLEDWSEDVAKQRAKELNIQLTDAHWDVIRFLQDYYLEEGTPRAARVVGQALEKRYEDKGGRRYLFTLFPEGPVRQGSYLAGVPIPPHSRNASFGSVE